jgi:hypothetical protein
MAMRPERIGTFLLVGATIVVGLSIVLDGLIARVLNGAGGLAWFAAAALLSLAAFRTSASPRLWIAAGFLTALVAFVVRPSDLALATAGFGIAGLVIVSLAPDHDLLWAKLVAGMYLPLHVGTAIAKAVARSVAGVESAVRTDPPPTAALVPFVMVMAAVGGGLVARHLAVHRRGRSKQVLAPDS